MLSEKETAALVVRAQRGDSAAFSQLVQRFLRAAFSIALGIVRRPADAEDVAQDALVLALEKIATCRDPERFAAWLFQIVRNQARNWLDKRRLRDVPRGDDQASRSALDAAHFERGGGPGGAGPPDTGLKERLAAALSELSQVQQEVVLLHDLEDWTHAEIGAALEISEVMSRQHLFNARRVLRGKLAEDRSGEMR